MESYRQRKRKIPLRYNPTTPFICRVERLLDENMRTKGMLAIAVIVAFVAAGGIGFATVAWTSSATISGSVSAGTLGSLTWGTEPGPANTPGVSDASICDHGTISPSNSWTGLYGNYFAQGDYCSFSDALILGGNLDATLTETVNVYDAYASCGLQYWTYYDNIGGTTTFTSGQGVGPVTVSPTGSVNVAPGSYSFQGYFELDSGAPAGCMGDTFTITAITITATAY